MPLFVASILSEMSARAAQGGGRVAAEQVAKIAVPENLAAIIEHYIAKLENEQRTLLSAAAVCGVQFRVNTIAAALERDAAWVGDICDQLVARAAMARRPACRGRQRGGRVAVFVQARAVPPGAVRAHVAIGPCTASPENRHCARTRTRRSSAGLRRRVGHAFRASRRGDGRRALLRRSRRSRSCALQPGRVHRGSSNVRRRCSNRRRTVPSATHCKSRSERFTASLLPECLAQAARQRARSSERTRCSTTDAAASDARSPAARIRIHALPARRICRGARGGRSRGSARIDDQRSGASVDRVHRAWAGRSASGSIAGCPDMAGARARPCRAAGRGSWRIPGGSAGRAARRCSPIPLLHLGLVEAARSCVQRALARARDRGWPMARLVAIWYSALFEVRLGNAERVAALADEMHALVDEFALAHGRTACRWFRGWADARMGAPRDGYQRIRDAYEDNVRLGMLAGASETLGYATEALLLAGDLDGAQKQLEEALQIADNARRARVSAAALSLGGCDRSFAWRARSCRRLGSTRDRGGQSPRGTVARADGARSNFAIAERATAADRRALATLVDQLPDARDTAAVARARVLLERTQQA